MVSVVLKGPSAVAAVFLISWLVKSVIVISYHNRGIKDVN